MKKVLINKILYTCLGLCLIIFSSCQKDLIKLVESQKDISGTWKIVKIVRNKEDLTSRVDLSSFRIVFNSDKTYALQGQFPFIVNDAGTFSLDDPQYPFNIGFQEQSSATKTSIKFDYPIVGAQRQIILTISPGCSNNTYEYTFEKVQ